MISTVRWVVSQIDRQTATSSVEEDIRSRCADARERGHDITPEREDELVEEATAYFRELQRQDQFSIWSLNQ